MAESSTGTRDQAGAGERLPMISSISETMLRPRLAELGKIKIGGKGDLKTSKKGNEFRQPIKFDHFVITRRERDGSDNFVRDDAIHAKVGEKPKTLDFFLYHETVEESFQYFLSAYKGEKEICRGNGVEATDREHGVIPCPCPLLEQFSGKWSGPKRPTGATCKPKGRLSVELAAAEEYGGYYTFRTTSWETIASIAGALRHIRQQFRHLEGLQGLPLRLRIYPATDTRPDGGRATSYKVGVVLAASYEDVAKVTRAALAWRERNLLPPGAADEHRAQLEAADEADAADFSAEFHPATVVATVADEEAESIDDGEDVEVVVEEEEAEDPETVELRAVLTRALEIAEVAQEQANRALLKFEDDLAGLESYIRTHRPAALQQAREEARIAAEAAAMERPDEEEAEAEEGAATDDELDLFGE